MLRKISMLFVFALVGATVALAQNPHARFDGRSSITVAVDGFTCNNNQGVIPALSGASASPIPRKSTRAVGPVPARQT